MVNDSKALEIIAKGLGILGAMPPTTDDALLREVEGARGHLLRALTIASGAGVPGSTESVKIEDPRVEASEPAESPDSDDDKKTLEAEDLIIASKSEIAVQALHDRGCALKNNEILEYFREIGREDMTEGSALSSLAKSLRRRAAHTGDIFELPGKPTRWDLVERYNVGELARLLSEAAFAEDKQREIQRRRTKEGLQRAKEERGYTPGPAPKLSREQAIEMMEMLDRKEKTKVITDKFNISARTVYLWRDRLAGWNPDTDDWPPPPLKKDDDEQEDDRPSLRLVE